MLILGRRRTAPRCLDLTHAKTWLVGLTLYLLLEIMTGHYLLLLNTDIYCTVALLNIESKLCGRNTWKFQSDLMWFPDRLWTRAVQYLARLR
jgi:hypothetical protein